MFTQQDIAQIEARGLSVEQVNQQIENFRTGFPSLAVVRAASGGDGVRQLTDAERDAAQSYYDSKAANLQTIKFVPASGAATRMFKELFEYVNDDKRTPGIDKLIDNVKKFAFYPELCNYITDNATDKEIVRNIIIDGLGYGKRPKGLVTFHAYADGARKPVEEHLVEAALYASNGDRATIHFTVSPEHQAGFEALLAERQPFYEQKFGKKFDISFSQQSPATDTIAVNPDNTPFRTAEGKLLFRPAGHGALLTNLNALDADVIFIKNIDNVTTDARKADTVTYKKVLAGELLRLQDKVFALLSAYAAGEDKDAEAVAFLRDELCCALPDNPSRQLIIDTLDRPIRVCGMVRNEGEPGGGPFWVRDEQGREQLQIAESSQIGADDLHLMKSATHFNPVDLVCTARRYDGSKFNLMNYTDPKTGFISSKSADGRELRAQELPGLWNGAMANWNTLFVEVPITTFSPVKVVQDLLRAEHQ
ncbi:MAG: DUF4301 family protein [Tidjanibacter sp.]|nr:DUF4301 family protein [Tidjanibacter sp.]MBR4037891.1 DUF4301 family protein [Tidjanibacter sp.]MBR4064148.1 DUF4301 family protein [Tidjanibacter sp.]MBR6813308.1 DUF4301 family protein [Tidjanibacter sp.]MBR7102303.1 DUF4301 family protein [Tidjanibacter sp.]